MIRALLLLIVLCFAVPIPAHADVSVDFCSKSREVYRQPPPWPTRLVRLDVAVKDGVETVVRAPAELMQEIRSMNLPERRLAYVKFVIARRNGGDVYMRLDEHPDAPDGQYVVLTTADKMAATPAYREYVRDCLGKEWTGSPWFRIGQPLAYERCTGDCSEVRDVTLIDRVYGYPEVRTFTIDTELRTMVTPNATRDVLARLGLPRSGASFVLLSSDMLDLDRIGASRAGNVGSVFHPEVFRVKAVVRRYLDKDHTGHASSYLMTSVRSVSPCPDGDWALLCAPHEAASRKIRVSGYPETRCFGTGDCASRESALARRYNARLRLGGLMGTLVALCMIGGSLIYAHRRRDSTSWHSTMVFGMVLGLSSMGALVLFYVRSRG